MESSKMQVRKRRDYENDPISKDRLKADPFEQFTLWYEDAVEEGLLEPNAMVLATASKDGRPSCRTVLLKELDETGLIFYTDTRSRKARELRENPQAALTFLWLEYPRQVIVEGTVEPVSRKRTETYFASRPRKSQIEAMASHQGAVLSCREELEKRFQTLENEYEGKEIPAPLDWSGYRLIPTSFEFWSGRRNRRHDRFLYTLKEKEWSMVRLSP